MKKISVQLDLSSVRALEKIQTINRCSISDAVNMALISFAQREEQVINNEDESLYKKVTFQCLSKFNMSIKDWCLNNAIDIRKLQEVCRKISDNKTIIGYGNLRQKWRDKNDGRIYKTQTSYVEYCMRRDFEIA